MVSFSDTATVPAEAPAEAAPVPEENKIAEKKDEVKDVNNFLFPVH